MSSISGKPRESGGAYEEKETIVFIRFSVCMPDTVHVLYGIRRLAERKRSPLLL